MAVKTSLIISNISTDNSKIIGKTVTNISPTATDAECKTFATALNNLTKRTLSGIARIDRTDLADVTDKNPYFTATPATVSMSSYSSGKYAYVILQYKGNNRTVTTSGQKPISSTITVENKRVTIKGGNGDMMGGSSTATLTLTLAGDSQYDEATVDITFPGLAASEVVSV